MKTNIKKKSMYDWMKDLFPYCRSITGNGIRQSLKYFEKINPEFKRIKFPTGRKVFDWTIPKEWNIKDAYIEHESGKSPNSIAIIIFLSTSRDSSKFFCETIFKLSLSV